VIHCLTRQLVDGCQLYEAMDGAEALAQLRRTPVDLLISGMNLPTMHGLELLRAIKSDTTLRHIPVLLLSSETRQEFVFEAAALGAAAYLRIPFTQDALWAKVKPLLQEGEPSQSC
jgi:two-component system, chemotaxis family, chemotaxis protein CheY